MKTLVDNFSVLSIEKCLLQKLPDMFKPETVIGLDDTQVPRRVRSPGLSEVERQRSSKC
jgi:hypothetical protein